MSGIGYFCLIIHSSTVQEFGPDASVGATDLPALEEDLTTVGKMLIVRNFYLWTRYVVPVCNLLKLCSQLIFFI